MIYLSVYVGHYEFYRRRQSFAEFILLWIDFIVCITPALMLVAEANLLPEYVTGFIIRIIYVLIIFQNYEMPFEFALIYWICTGISLICLFMLLP
eukprot:UN10919